MPKGITIGVSISLEELKLKVECPKTTTFSYFAWMMKVKIEDEFFLSDGQIRFMILKKKVHRLKV